MEGGRRERKKDNQKGRGRYSDKETREEGGRERERAEPAQNVEAL